MPGGKLGVIGKAVRSHTPVLLKPGPMSQLERFQQGVDVLPSLDALQLNDSRLWGSQGWTGEEVRALIVAGIAEGLGIRRVLEGLQAQYGEMPTIQRVYAWRKAIASFDRDYRAAREARGEQAADVATEIALEMTPETAQADRERIKHLQWLAGKLNHRDYGERKTVENEKAEEASDDQLDKRIHAIMKRLGMETKVMDAEVVEDTPAEPAGENE